ncbi:MAG TPA: hypothetical protein V6C78_15865 [Crinalium sp.]
MQHHEGNLWNRHHNLFHLRRSPYPITPPLPVIRLPTVAYPFLPAAIASKPFIMEFANLSSRQQTARPALLIERSPHTTLPPKAPYYA